MKRNEAFDILGLQEEATDDDVKKSFRKLASENHPDKFSGEEKTKAETKFKQINQAFQILSGKEKADDEQIQNPFGGGFGGPGISIEDIMSNFMGFGHQHTHYDVRRGGHNINLEDIIVQLEVSFEEAILGCTKHIAYTVKDYCKECEAQGTDPNGRKQCRDCGGSGYKNVQINQAGFIRINRTFCTTCRGSGIVGSKTCFHCEGKTFKEREVSVNVKIPPVGDRIRAIQLKGKGHSYDTFHSSAIIEVKPTVEGKDTFANYYIENDNVRSSVNVTLDKLLFGGKETINIIGADPVEIEIKPLTKVFDEIVIKNYGVRNKTPGNHIVTIDVKYPDKNKLTEELKKSLEDMYK